MAMKVVYATANGRVLSETRNGSRRLYSLDPLGNTRALYDNTQTKTDTFTYFPSGTVASRTGTTPTPFQWNGGSGYYQNSANRVYVRARNFYVNLGRWSTQDPIGFKAGDYNLYRYVNNRFVNVADPSGLACTREQTTNVSNEINAAMKLVRAPKSVPIGDGKMSCVTKCIADNLQSKRFNYPTLEELSRTFAQSALSFNFAQMVDALNKIATLMERSSYTKDCLLTLGTQPNSGIHKGQDWWINVDCNVPGVCKGVSSCACSEGGTDHCIMHFIEGYFKHGQPDCGIRSDPSNGGTPGLIALHEMLHCCTSSLAFSSINKLEWALEDTGYCIADCSK